jgi:hypothetical protein
MVLETVLPTYYEATFARAMSSLKVAPAESHAAAAVVPSVDAGLQVCCQPRARHTLYPSTIPPPPSCSHSHTLHHSRSTRPARYAHLHSPRSPRRLQARRKVSEEIRRNRPLNFLAFFLVVAVLASIFPITVTSLLQRVHIFIVEDDLAYRAVDRLDRVIVVEAEACRIEIWEEDDLEDDRLPAGTLMEVRGEQVVLPNTGSRITAKESRLNMSSWQGGYAASAAETGTQTWRALEVNSPVHSTPASAIAYCLLPCTAPTPRTHHTPYRSHTHTHTHTRFTRSARYAHLTLRSPPPPLPLHSFGGLRLPRSLRSPPTSLAPLTPPPPLPRPPRSLR